MSIAPAALEALHRHTPETRIAVIGASNDPAKYGNTIVKNLVRHGYAVLPIHPSARQIAGLPAYARTADVAGPIAIADFVVPPAVALRVLDELDPQQIAVIWLQPGSFDEAVVTAARAKFRDVVVGDCIMVVAGWA